VWRSFRGIGAGYRDGMAENVTPLRALALVCSLKPSPSESSSEMIAGQVLHQLRRYDAECESVRCVDYHLMPGVEADMGDSDQWPQIRQKVLDADILVMATPTWLGHMSSVAQRVLERLDAELSNTDQQGRPAMLGKVAIAAVVGNEDGAHKIVADLFQALNDVGYTVAAQGCTYWNDHAMGTNDFKDIGETPPEVATTTANAARNAAHLARSLRSAQYPPYQ
jgi:multimeric flavodoxin WrbA